MNQSTLDQLTMSLKDYNATAYELMGTISGSMEKVAILLLLLFMGINLMNWHQHLKSNGGELSFQLWIEEILKYAIALFFIHHVTSDNNFSDSLIRVKCKRAQQDQQLSRDLTDKVNNPINKLKHSF